MWTTRVDISEKYVKFSNIKMGSDNKAVFHNETMKWPGYGEN